MAQQNESLPIGCGAQILWPTAFLVGKRVGGEMQCRYEPGKETLFHFGISVCTAVDQLCSPEQVPSTQFLISSAGEEGS